MQCHVALMEKSLWREFDSQCNEMIITKIGRNLFPILEFAFKGLCEHLNYKIGVTMEPISYQKLKFTAGRWESLDIQEEMVQPNEVFLMKSGRELLQRGLKLEKLKLTNSKDALQKSDQMIRVQSMRQYMPVLNIYEISPVGAHNQIGKFQFPETKFIAVTAYQSELVKQLKVQKNKFAQGFRESIKSNATSSTKRPLSTTSSNSSPDSTLSMSSENLGHTTKKGRGGGQEIGVLLTSQNYQSFDQFSNFSQAFPPNFQPSYAQHYPIPDYQPNYAQFGAENFWSLNPAPYDFTAAGNFQNFQWNG
ncbi:T-box domain-containing protein [Caenorhabditis elegans]|uniref:T-box domain-containing protein n=1 Tax=Caenorhabditis elegans TaxID=6239 RepID=Q1T6W8_CAEEL|nr:T-box domain-containing protein [Caenorhabditis elegans]CCD73786.1 T-box domain-containing protein [Caenorhabditis elegans]|eukprot:NP_001040883.1 T BoX family [Caenorhabditis elegans]